MTQCDKPHTQKLNREASLTSMSIWETLSQFCQLL